MYRTNVLLEYVEIDAGPDGIRVTLPNGEWAVFDNGFGLLCEGEADLCAVVEFSVQRPEPDVGIFGWGLDECYICTFELFYDGRTYDLGSKPKECSVRFWDSVLDIADDRVFESSDFEAIVDEVGRGRTW